METTILDQHEMYYPELAKQIQELKLYQQERLWYQLGELLIEYIKNEVFQEEDHLIQLYTGFVKQFENKIDQIKLMMFIMKTSNQFKSNEESINFLNDFRERVLKDNQAKQLCEIQKGHHLLNLSNQEATFTIIQQTTKNLEQMNTTIEPFVQASLHQLCARYYKFRNNYEKFYMHSLQFLAYTPENVAFFLEIKQNDKIKISLEMGIAILISKNMYNFSELLEQPILQALKETEYIWIYELLVIFNNGDVNAFNQKIIQYQAQMESFVNFT